MPAVKERSLGVARLYARAMLEVASDAGVAQSLGEELDEVLDLARRDPEFERFLSSPVLEREKRRRSIETTLRGRASDLLVDALQVVNKKDRLSVLPQIVQSYHDAHRELLGQVEVRIATAVPLTDEMRRQIRDRTRARTGKETHLIEVVNPELLGGLVVQVGDQKIDMSVRRDLELLSRRFADRLSRELMSAGSDFAMDDSGPDAPSGDARSSQSESSQDREEEE